MKQNITKEQWDELSDEQKAPLAILMEDTFYSRDIKNCNIGLMIEFLGDGFLFINTDDGGKLWQVITKAQDYPFIKEELADALWEAVKQELNKTI